MSAKAEMVRHAVTLVLALPVLAITALWGIAEPQLLNPWSTDWLLSHFWTLVLPVLPCAFGIVISASLGLRAAYLRKHRQA